MTQILRNVQNNNLLKVLHRYMSTHGKEHWSVLKKKSKPKDKALAHFDDFYSSIYGDVWQNIKAALLNDRNKHVAIVNNFSDSQSTIQDLQLQGAMDMHELYIVHKKNKEERDKRKSQVINPDLTPFTVPLEEILKEKRQEEIQSLYPESYEAPENVQPLDEDGLPTKAPNFSPVQMRPLENDLESVEQDVSRIIKPSIGLSTATLYEYVPATKLRGLDGYVLESEHFSHYAKGANFEIHVEKEPVLSFPNHLKVYTFEPENPSVFPAPRRRSELYDYYLMDGGSLLPVLALDLQPGDTMLDMCAAPGGKTFVALQTLMPKVLIANDSSLSRINQLNTIMNDYLGDLNVWEDRLFVTNQDARIIEEKDVYNKILVDVPCTTDRHVLHSDDNNLFKPTRIKERLQLPEMQTDILLHALKIVPPGGTVVYSTCTLSPIQNDGVVQMALKKCFEENQSVFVVKDLTEAFGPLHFLYKFGVDFGVKYGHMILPTRNNNWGPIYFYGLIVDGFSSAFNVIEGLNLS